MFHSPVSQMMIKLMQYDERIVKYIRIRRINALLVSYIYSMYGFSFTFDSTNDNFWWLYVIKIGQIVEVILQFSYLESSLLLMPGFWFREIP